MSVTNTEKQLRDKFEEKDEEVPMSKKLIDTSKDEDAKTIGEKLLDKAGKNNESITEAELNSNSKVYNRRRMDDIKKLKTNPINAMTNIRHTEIGKDISSKKGLTDPDKLDFIGNGKTNPNTQKTQLNNKDGNFDKNKEILPLNEFQTNDKTMHRVAEFNSDLKTADSMIYDIYSSVYSNGRTKLNEREQQKINDINNSKVDILIAMSYGGDQIVEEATFLHDQDPKPYDYSNPYDNEYTRYQQRLLNELKR